MFCRVDLTGEHYTPGLFTRATSVHKAAKRVDLYVSLPVAGTLAAALQFGVKTA